MHVHTHVHTVCHKLVQREWFKIIISKPMHPYSIILHTAYDLVHNLCAWFIIINSSDLVILSNAVLVAIYVVTFDGELLY